MSLDRSFTLLVFAGILLLTFQPVVNSRSLLDHLHKKSFSSSSSSSSIPSKPLLPIPTQFKRSLIQAFLRATGEGDWFRNLQLLGQSNFVSDFMSIRDPRLVDGGANAGAILSKPDVRHEMQIEKQIDDVFGGDNKIMHSKIGQKLQRKLTKLLTDFTQCPVVFEWQDLGDRFWPRFIRTGSCSQKKSCSFPSGMGCKPAEESHLTLLRRFCGSRRWGKAEVEPFRYDAKCRFIAVKYPIITKCSCSC